MTGYQIPRNSLAWMLVAQAAVSAPHVVRLPIWITVVCVACGIWRVMIYQGRWSYPSRLVKVLFTVIGFAGIPIAYSKLTGLEPAITLLIVAFFLKLLEMHDKKDAYIVILLGYFVAITEFLFFQSIPYAIYMFFTVVLITTALIGLHQTKTHVHPFRTFRTAMLLIGQAIPLMIVLFVLFPRISPLWTVPLQAGVGKTGVTDSMSPGDIALLTQSDALAFRATFEGQVPGNRQLYWRGLVLSEFDGKTWQRGNPIRRGVWRVNREEPEWVDAIEYGGEQHNYNIVLEATQQNWMFALAMPEVPLNDNFFILADYNVATRSPIRNTLRYKLRSHLNTTLAVELNDYWQYRYTRVPENSNPRTQALAKSMLASAPSKREYIDDVLRMYNQEEFIYTLKPPILGPDGIDEFIMESKRGFCEHYAGSFVFMMRAAGIPARVVLGYQGGEYNPRGNYVSVRQFDAHAWTELWLEGQGWVRFDPTSAVAPERIESGLEAAVEDENSFLSDSPLSIFRYRQLLWLTDLRLQMDSIGHYWDAWVVGYTPETQLSLLSEYLGDVDKQQIYFLMLSVFFGILSAIGFIMLAKRSKAVMNPADAQYQKFCIILKKNGFPRFNGEGPNDFASRVSREIPSIKDEILAVTKAYVDAAYKDSVDTDLKALKQAVRTIRLKSLTANFN
jgi:transglutaminase-like putative cysteine protease